MTPLEKKLREPGFVVGSLVFALAMLFVYIYTQVLGNLANVDVWVANVPVLHALLLIVFAVVFGITFQYQLFLLKQPKVCSPQMKTTGTGISGIGTIGIFLIAQCPACASLGALFLPVSAVTFFTQYAVGINVLSIGLLLFTLHYLGAFTPMK